MRMSAQMCSQSNWTGPPFSPTLPHETMPQQKRANVDGWANDDYIQLLNQLMGNTNGVVIEAVKEDLAVDGEVGQLMYICVYIHMCVCSVCTHALCV